MVIRNYTFGLTCRACPEQYDVLDPSGNLAFYVRYRHGQLTCNPYEGDDINFDKTFLHISIDDWSGSFDDDEQREEMLTRCLIAYIKYRYFDFDSNRKPSHEEVMNELNRELEELCKEKGL